MNNKANKANTNKANTNNDTIKGDVTMNKNTENTKNTKNTALVNSTITSVIKEITSENATPCAKIEEMFERAIHSESNARLARARLYYAISESAQVRSMIDFKSMESFIEAHDYGDKKSTASEMVKVYRLFYAEGTETITSFVKKAYLTYTEMLEIAKTAKGVSTKEEKSKEIENFCSTYIIDDVKQWNTTKELRDIVNTYIYGVDVKPKAVKENKESKESTESKGNTDYTSVKSLADTTAKEANAAIKALKESGDLVENKAKGTVTITAKSVNEFMNALVSLAKKQGVKPTSFTGLITFTISGHE